jgi:hypothetical protein
MIIECFYLSNDSNIPRALELTGLSMDELETIVGRFAAHSWRSGLLRGEVVVYEDKIVIRHHFTKKRLWECVYEYAAQMQLYDE